MKFLAQTTVPLARLFPSKYTVCYIESACTLNSDTSKELRIDSTSENNIIMCIYMCDMCNTVRTYVCV